MHKKYLVRLSDAERAQLTELTRKGPAAASQLRHAPLLLQADAHGPSWTDPTIAESFSVSVPTVRGGRQRLVAQGLAAALNRQKPPPPARRAWMARARHAGGRSGAGSRPQDTPAGPCGSWPTKRWRGTWGRRAAMRRADRRAKKCREAPAAETVGHSARAQWRVGGTSGRGLGSLPDAVGSPEPGGRHGCPPRAVDPGDPAAAPRCPRKAGQSR